MDYGINLGYVTKKLSAQKAIEMIAKAGFKALDYTPPVKEHNWHDSMTETLECAQKNGLYIAQTHGPFNRYGSYGNNHIAAIDRAYRATVELGAKYMVVHGDEYPSNMTFDAEIALKYNHDLYLPYVKQAEKDGVKIAFETVFEDGKPIRRFCSKSDELKALIESFNSPSAVCCWDFGHAYAEFGDKHVEELKKLIQYVECTHVHDNHGADYHEMPFMGNTDWDSCVKIMKEAGYNGVFCLEYVYGNMPEFVMEKYLKLSVEVCDYMWNQ